jgi:hypothetical protein
LYFYYPTHVFQEFKSNYSCDINEITMMSNGGETNNRIHFPTKFREQKQLPIEKIEQALYSRVYTLRSWIADRFEGKDAVSRLKAERATKEFLALLNVRTSYDSKGLKAKSPASIHKKTAALKELTAIFRDEQPPTLRAYIVALVNHQLAELHSLSEARRPLRAIGARKEMQKCFKFLEEHPSLPPTFDPNFIMLLVKWAFVEIYDGRIPIGLPPAFTRIIERSDGAQPDSEEMEQIARKFLDVLTRHVPDFNLRENELV